MKEKVIAFVLQTFDKSYKMWSLVALCFLGIFHNVSWFLVIVFVASLCMAFDYFQFEYERRFLDKSTRRQKNREIIGPPKDEE